MPKRASRTKPVRGTEIVSFVAWLSVDKDGRERLMVWAGAEAGLVVPLLAFDREGEDRIDRMARVVVSDTGRPGRKVQFIRGRLAGEFYS